MSKKNKIYSYDPIIYPRKLWIIPSFDKELLTKFLDRDGKQINIDIDGCSGASIQVLHKKTNKLGELIIFNSPKDATPNVIVHESAHATLNICLDLNMIVEKDCQEHFTYLIGWIVDCCYKSLKGKSDE